jgi:hypothetical protein
MLSFGAPEDEIAEFTSQMTPLGFVANGFFQLYFHIFVMVMYIRLVSQLVTKPVDTTSMACYLSLPISRKKYVFSTYFSLFLPVILCGLSAYVGGVVTFSLKSADINYWNYLNISVTATLQSLAVAFISLTLGFIFAGTKYKSLPIVAPIVLLFIILFYDMAEWLNWLRWLSPFGWADYSALASGTLNLWWLVILGCAVICGVCIYLSARFFKKRNLSI